MREDTILVQNSRKNLKEEEYRKTQRVGVPPVILIEKDILYWKLNSLLYQPPTLP